MVNPLNDWRDMPQGDSWKTTSGLLDDFDHEWREVWFGTDARFGEGKTLLLVARGPAFIEGEEVDEEHTLFYSCGDGWKEAKGGREAKHSSGKTSFTDNSNIGKLIDRLVELGPEIIKELKARGETFQADTFEGLRFHMERKKFQFKNRKTGEASEYEVVLPTDFLGVVDGEAVAPKKATGASKRAAAKPAEEEEAEPPKKATGVTKKATGAKTAPKESLRDAVVKFAVPYEEHASFVTDVMDPDVFPRAEEIQEDEELANDILDEDGSVWTDAIELANAE